MRFLSKKSKVKAHLYVDFVNVCALRGSKHNQEHKPHHMAIFHFTAKIIGRSSGRSSTSASAYRAGVKITDRRTGMIFDFTRKSGCDDSVILAPENAPAWVYDRSELWNRVEEKENRKDSQVCREMEFALPRDLTREQMKALALDFVKNQFVNEGMIADVAFHKLNTGNPHCHVMLTMREISPNGFGQKVRAWNERELVEKWRESWATHANKALKEAGHSDRIDHRTLIEQAHEAAQVGDMDKARELDRLPMFHEGYGPRAQFIHADNIERMGENWKKKEEWDAIEAQAMAEARLMAPYSDARPQTTTTKELTHETEQQPTRRWVRTVRTVGSNSSRPIERPITERSLDAQRMRSYRDGSQPVLSLSRGDNFAIIKPRWRPKRVSSSVRGNEQGHTSDSAPLHLASGITKQNLYTLGRKQSPALIPSPALAPAPALVGQQAKTAVAKIVSVKNSPLKQLARDDEAMREWARNKENTTAINWFWADKNAQIAKKWLDEHKDEESRRMDVRDQLKRKLTLEEINYQKWKTSNPEPKRYFWNKAKWEEWEQSRKKALTPVKNALEKYELAFAQADLVVSQQLQRQRDEKQKEFDRCIKNRQAIALLPSEKHEQQHLFNKFPERPTATTTDTDIRDIANRRKTLQKSEVSTFKPKGM